MRRRTKLEVDVGRDFTSGYLVSHCDKGLFTPCTCARRDFASMNSTSSYVDTLVRDNVRNAHFKRQIGAL